MHLMMAVACMSLGVAWRGFFRTLRAHARGAVSSLYVSSVFLHAVSPRFVKQEEANENLLPETAVLRRSAMARFPFGSDKHMAQGFAVLL
jgi:hypothetical protein